MFEKLCEMLKTLESVGDVSVGYVDGEQALLER